MEKKTGGGWEEVGSVGSALAASFSCSSFAWLPGCRASRVISSLCACVCVCVTWVGACVRAWAPHASIADFAGRLESTPSPPTQPTPIHPHTGQAMWCPRHRFLVSSSSSTRRWPTTRKRCRSDTPSIAPQAGAVRSQSTAPLQHHHLHRAPLPRVCGVVILHRHGERAPMVNFGGRGPEAAAAQEEERRWLDRLPAAAELALLDSQFPVQSAAARTPRDRASRPFGCLTEKGLASMRELGRGIKKLHPGVLDVAGGAEGPGEPEAESRRRGKADAATAAPVQFDVFSSNFSRTQQSAQGLLHGLGAYQLAAGGQVPVRVRGERECTIHMYDNDPGTIQEEVAKVLNAPSFLARQAEQEALKRDLVRLIPGLTSEGFKWMEAADFFWCWPQDDLDMAPELKVGRDTQWVGNETLCHPPTPFLCLTTPPLSNMHHRSCASQPWSTWPGASNSTTPTGPCWGWSSPRSCRRSWAPSNAWPRPTPRKQHFPPAPRPAATWAFSAATT